MRFSENLMNIGKRTNYSKRQGDRTMPKSDKEYAEAQYLKGLKVWEEISESTGISLDVLLAKPKIQYVQCPRCGSYIECDACTIDKNGIGVWKKAIKGMPVGEQIKQLRKKKGLTQKELAHRLGVSQMMVSQYENKQRNPKLETIEKIMAALKNDCHCEPT